MIPIYKHGEQKLFVVGGGSALNPNVPLTELFDVGPFSMVINADAISTVPLLTDSVIALAMKRIINVSDSIPIMKGRRVTSADEVDIYDFRFSGGMIQYQTGSVSGTWNDLDEQIFAVNWYDQSGNTNHAGQTTAAKQPELKWGAETVGNNLSINSTFTNWTGDDPDNYTVFAEDANNYITEAAGSNAARIVSDGSVPLAIQQKYQLDNSKYYRFSLDIQNYLDGDARIIINDSGGIILPATNMGWEKNGTYDLIFKPISGINVAISLYRVLGGNTDYEFTNWELAEVTKFNDYPYLDFSSSPLRYMTIADDATLKPSTISMYANCTFDGAGSRERIIDKSVTDGCDGSWHVEKQTDDTVLFRQVSTGCINHDVASTNDAIVDGSTYNDIITTYQLTSQNINLNDTVTSTGYIAASFETSTSNIGIGVKEIGELFPMNGRYKALFIYNVEINDIFGNALQNEVW